MYAAQMQAYRSSQVQKENLSEREIDAYALTQSALMLQECQKNWDMPADADNNLGNVLKERERIDRLFEALRLNSLLWSIYQAEITTDGNPLPRKLREDLLTLSLFIDKRTKDIMCYPEPEKLTILININLNIAAGLSASSAQERPSRSHATATGGFLHPA
jgi:flagellar protein FlaF